MLPSHALRVLLTGTGAVILALLLTPLSRSVMRRVGAIDLPGGRRVHTKPTPRGAGWAIIVAALLATWLAAGGSNGLLTGILAGLSVLLPLCIIDDIWGLPPLQRLIGQLVAAALAWRFGIKVEGVTNFLSFLGGPHYLSLGWLSAPVTIIWLVFMMNAVNWLDGLDGLAAGICAISASAVAYMAYVAGMTHVAVAAAALAGACAGFLRYNFHPASVFMGDTGAMPLGLMLAAISTAAALRLPQ
ncbi:MAG: undecaprenyl/decaprenyl-phosphate alpha-N-acetylglucosaminyl 1-phosphate transferase [Armatimonadetes bacterium]|nr:undecaprenyl/decaprenyl-phosphate alpha-N-acetylglucosaminyl 1-phosphate transferase [Armatimonadota bacterium]